MRIDAEIGHGGFATVYRARQMSVDRDVAVKVDQRRLLDARDRRRFAREIIAAGAVSAHPNIVTLYDGGTTSDDHPYLVMELYANGSYADRMRTRGPVPITEVLDVGFAIADALVAAHAEGILHRDVKPANILISRYGSPALTDFGLAALAPAAEGYSVTMESLTPSYAPPESFSGAEPTALVDVYALGATLYAMAKGSSPRSDSSGASPPIARLLLLLNEPLPALTGPGTDVLMPVLWRATAIRPQDRYQTAAELRDALAAARAGRPQATRGLWPFGPPVSASPPGSGDRGGQRPPPGPPPQIPAHPPPGPPSPPTRTNSRRWIAVAAALVVVAALVTGIVLLTRSHGTTTGGTDSSTATVPDTSPAPTSAAGSPTGGRTSRSGPTGTSRSSTDTRPSSLVLPPPVSRSSDVAVAGASTGSRTTATSSSANGPSVTASTNTTTAASGSTTAAANPTPSSSSVSVTLNTVPPAVGTCWRGLSLVNSTESAVRVSSCADAHDWEAYATGVLDPSTPSAAPADVLADPNVRKNCDSAHLQAYVGSGTGGKFNTEVLPPSDAEFARGNRGFWCLAHPAGKSNYTGSFRG